MLKEQIFKSVTDDMSKATARFSPSEIVGISEKETSKGNVSVLKKYNLTTVIGDRATLTLTDPELIKSVEKIKFAESGRKVFGYVICKELARIDESGKFKEFGFKTISQFAKALFGYQESTANHYVRIGKAFITDDYMVKDGLPEYSISHFIELNALVTDHPDGTVSTEKIEDLFLEGVIKDGMSTKQLREAIKRDSDKKVVDSTAEDLLEMGTQESGTQESGTQESQISSTENKPKMSENSTLLFDKIAVSAKALEALNTFLEQVAILKANNISIPDVTKSVALLQDVIKNVVNG